MDPIHTREIASANVASAAYSYKSAFKIAGMPAEMAKSSHVVLGGSSTATYMSLLKLKCCQLMCRKGSESTTSCAMTYTVGTELGVTAGKEDVLSVSAKVSFRWVMHVAVV
jgi:hypothetical protein